jgi:Mg-chelatase subunit ChlD
VPLVDVSDSMRGVSMAAAISLGALVSELTTPAFADRVLTFESAPRWLDLSQLRGIVAKARRVEAAGSGGSTDFEAACEQILAVAVSARLTPDEIPDLLVLSDMQFGLA